MNPFEQRSREELKTPPVDDAVELKLAQDNSGEDRKAIAKRLGLNENARWVDIYRVKDEEIKKEKATALESLNLQNSPDASVTTSDNGSKHEAVRRHLDSLIERKLDQQQLIIEHVGYIETSSRQLRKRIQVVLEQAQANFQGLATGTLIQNLEEGFNKLEKSSSVLRAGSLLATEKSNQIREFALSRPENISALVEHGLVKQLESDVDDADATLPGTIAKIRGNADKFFQQVNDQITKIDNLLTERKLPADERKLKEKLEKLLKFNPGFENN
ncbi:MAG: hypothetical protein EXS46_01370 [Candidatus Taylorbacteria bacterium]|nr:hypothetical protein [Candidatus Taylorbacteria bacterium]